MTSEEIQAIFFVECEEALAAAEAGLAACQAGSQDDDTINAIFRAVHSIKGGAGAFGFSALQGFTHTFETLLSDVRDRTVLITDPLVDLMLRALDTLSDHVVAAREGGEAPDDGDLLEDLTRAQAANAAAGAPEHHVPQTEPVEPPVEAIGDEPESGCDLDLDTLLDSLAGDLAPAPSEAAPCAPDQLVRLRPHAGALANGGEPLLLLRDLAAIGGRCLSCDSASVPPLDALDPGCGYLGWSFALPADVPESAVREIFDFVGEDCGLAFGAAAALPAIRSSQAMAPAPVSAPAARPAASRDSTSAESQGAAPLPGAAGGQTIRIELAKLDRLIDTVGELVIAQAMVAQRVGSAGSNLGEELALIEGLTREIQESAMAIRAQPIGSVFSRVPRILRELTASTGKQVRLEVFGEATELDKTVIERLGEPLTHLIRNAVDHGIESSEERLAAGKSAEGTLWISAEQRSGRILIRIADNGRGIDRKRVLAKAVEKGLVAPDAQLSSEEIDALIFAPGFSTAQAVSNISGRGVGMDVVRQNVKDLGGRIGIESSEGKGTTFTLTLPLTLAISDGMIVRVGDQLLVVPLTHVVESLRPTLGDVTALGTRRHMLNVRGRFIPVVPVAETIGAEGGSPSPEAGVLIVVDTEATGQAALLVDDICDQRQFVIKSLDANYRTVEGVAGATILGEDGRVALILDVDGLVAACVSPRLREAA